jgi:deoxyadenosine/deoxycytidine kinase
MKTQLITIIGNVASGKSTAVPFIAQEIQAERVDADNFFQTIDPFAKHFLKDISRWAFANELWLTYERAKLIRKTLQEVTSPYLLIDSGLLMSWVYTRSHYIQGLMTEAEWQLYENLYQEIAGDLLEDMLVVYLDYSLPTLMERLHKRGRDYELEYYNENYLNQIQQGLAALYDKLSSQATPTLAIKEHEVADFEASLDDRQHMLSSIKDFLTTCRANSADDTCSEIAFAI